MKLSLIAGLANAAIVAASVQRRACGNNCDRAVGATRFGLATSAARLGDCNSYLRATVTLPTSTVLVTQTVSTTVTEGFTQTLAPVSFKRDQPAADKRTITAKSSKSIPAYASPCSNSCAYISACYCAGATASTVTEEAITVTSIVTITSSVTVPGDSPPYTPTGEVGTPPSDFTLTYTYDEVALPTFDTMTTPVTFPPATPTVECLTDPADPDAEFYLLDQSAGYLFNTAGKAGPPAAPKTEAEALAMSDMSKFNPPLYKFEKPASGPAGLFDIVLDDGATKLYLALNTKDGNVVFTTGTTNGAVKDKLITTLFGVTCKGLLTARQGATTYIWKATQGGSTLTPGTSANDTVMLLPKAGRTPLTGSAQRRGKAESGKAPRCRGAPQDVIARLKPNARGNNPNGCGPANGMDFVPDFNFGRCCDGHDNCYDDCQGQSTFEQCNDNFHSCMQGKCHDLLGSIWTFWLYPGCMGMADVYAYVVGTDLGVKAFNTANSERCECACPNTQPAGVTQSLCTVNGQLGCTPTGGDDSHNCGGCGWECPYKTHCSRGGCQCDNDRCGNLCLSLLTHPRNCGACGNVCASGYCYMGTCFDPPADSDQCYPVEGFTNGDFSTQDLTGWSYTATRIGSPGSTFDNPFDFVGVGAFMQFPLNVNDYYNLQFTTVLWQDVHVCPGTAYELDFTSLYYGGGLCNIRVMLGNRQLAYRDYPIMDVLHPSPPAPFGPYPVGPFSEGDPGTSAGDKSSLKLKFSVEVSCSPGGVAFLDFSLHAA